MLNCAAMFYHLSGETSLTHATRTAFVLLALIIYPTSMLSSSQQIKPLDSKSAKSEYSFPVRVYEPQIPLVDPIPHAENKTITTHHEYFGGTHSDSVCVWMYGKVTEIASWGLANEGGMPGGDSNCPWTAFCYKRINGKMRTVTLKATGCNGADPEEVICTPPPVRTVNPPKHHPK
jgi:hypothetical protein